MKIVPQVSGAVEGRKSRSPIDLAHGLYNILYYRTSRDIAAVRPLLEYWCTVWHSTLTAAQCNVLEMVQKRIIRIIYSDGDYDTSLIVGDIGTDRLSDRREVLIFLIW